MLQWRRVQTEDTGHVFPLSTLKPRIPTYLLKGELLCEDLIVAVGLDTSPKDAQHITARRFQKLFERNEEEKVKGDPGYQVKTNTVQFKYQVASTISSTPSRACGQLRLCVSVSPPLTGEQTKMPSLNTWYMPVLYPLDLISSGQGPYELEIPIVVLFLQIRRLNSREVT